MFTDRHLEVRSHRPDRITGWPVGGDEGFVERELWVKIDRQVVGRKSHPLSPWKINGERAPIRWAAPLLGQHNKKVFCELLGMSEEELLKLTSDKVVGEVSESTA